jgi:serine/threonine-protein kinase RsbW
MRMPSRRNAIAPAVERILAVADRAGLAQEQRENLAVALAEALSNAAVHGNRLRERSLVSIGLELELGRSITVEVRDSGNGFDLSRLPDPSSPEHLLDTHGRGVFLMRRLVDRLEYNLKGNRVRMTALSHGARRHSGR